MNGKIFISYRRDDSSASAGRLYDRLSSHFGSTQIFMDVDNLDPGVDFVRKIEESVGSCDVLIAVIGKRWLISSDEEGKRRLDLPEDFVRVEIATALKRGIWVIPVLVDGALTPRAGDLPKNLRSLVRRQALTVSHDRFRADAERLIGAVERVLKSAPVELVKPREQECVVQAPGPLFPHARGVGPRRQQAPSAAEWLAEARRYLDAKDYANALPLLQKAASAGNTDAMYRLGVLYANAHGVAQDYAQARMWFQKAADAGNAEGMNYLGVLYQKGQGGTRDLGKARLLYEKAAGAGNSNAMWSLGWLYNHGLGVAEDHTKAREWYQKAADAGHEAARTRLRYLGWLLG
jgi:TIR domain/Sel1 repeat